MATPQKVAAEYYLFTYCPKDITKDVSFAYRNHLYTYFRDWNRCMSNFSVHPELTVSGNIHFHGFFVVKDTYKWHKHVLPKMKYNGFVKIDLVKSDLNKACEYHKKDHELMRKLITKKLPVPYTIESDRILYEPIPESIEGHFVKHSSLDD